jgi:predicted small metal-binding protein
MDKVLRCDCGYEVRVDDEAELILRVQRHALDAHAMAFTPEEVLRLAFRVEPNEPSWQPRLGGGATEDASNISGREEP